MTGGLDVHLKREHSVREDVVNMMMVNLDNNYGRRVNVSFTPTKPILKMYIKEQQDEQNQLLKQYLNPLRPFRCTICFESFEHDIGLQLHLLSPKHQERARPNIQKALMTLQTANLKAKCENERDSFTTVENSILDMLFSQSSEPSAELIDVAANETGIDSAKIRVWLEMKKKGDEKSDQSDTFSTSKDHDFSDDNSANGDKLKIDEGELKIDEASLNARCEVKSEKIEPKKESVDSDQSNRRMRTLISPDQAEVLYREYLEVNPPRHRRPHFIN